MGEVALSSSSAANGNSRAMMMMMAATRPSVVSTAEMRREIRIGSTVLRPPVWSMKLRAILRSSGMADASRISTMSAATSSTNPNRPIARPRPQFMRLPPRIASKSRNGTIRKMYGPNIRKYCCGRVGFMMFGSTPDACERKPSQKGRYIRKPAIRMTTPSQMI